MKAERLTPLQLVLGVHWSAVPDGSTVHPFGHWVFTDQLPLLHERRSLVVLEVLMTQLCWLA
jgi:hypothetical protein